MDRRQYYYPEEPLGQYYQQSGAFPQQPQFTSTVFSSPAQFGPHQEHYYYNNQPSIFQGQSYNSGVQPQQLQQPYYQSNQCNQQYSYPSDNAASNVPSYSPFATSSQPSSQNHHEYVQWLQQLQPGHGGGDSSSIERPWWMWCIAWGDVLYALFLAAMIIYKKIIKPIDADPEDDSFGVSIYQVFIGSLGVFLRLMMGLGLLTGLKSDDDSNTLWYSKMWAACQLVFVIISVIGLIAGALIYATHSPRITKEPPAVLQIFLVLVGRVISLLLVWYFIGKLKQAEAMSLGNRFQMTRNNGVAYSALQRGQMDDEEEQEQENKGHTYGSAGMCGSYVAMIM